MDQKMTGAKKSRVFGPSRISFSYFDGWRRAWKQRFSCMRTMSRFTSVPRIRPKSSEMKILIRKVMSGYAVLKSQPDRSRIVDFSLHRLRKNGSFSMNRRSYWAEIPGGWWQPLLKQGRFFSRRIFNSDFTDFPGKVFWALKSIKKSKKSRFFGLVQIVWAKAILC